MASSGVALQMFTLREEARALSPWRRRAIRQILPKEESPTPEAVHLAAAIRDRAARPGRLVLPIGVAAAASCVPVLAASLASPAARSSPWFAGLCGALAGLAAAALFAARQ